jgi:hypothetical protein
MKKPNVRPSGITMSVWIDNELLATMMSGGWIDVLVPPKYKRAQLATKKAIRKLPFRTSPSNLAKEIRRILALKKS